MVAVVAGPDNMTSFDACYYNYQNALRTFCLIMSAFVLPAINPSLMLLPDRISKFSSDW